MAVYGFGSELAQRLHGRINDDESDTGGIGGTLAGNALSIAAMRATLQHVLTEDAYRYVFTIYAAGSATAPMLATLPARAVLTHCLYAAFTCPLLPWAQRWHG